MKHRNTDNMDRIITFVNDFYREKPSVKFLLLKNAQAALFNTAIADEFYENAKERCDKNITRI